MPKPIPLKYLPKTMAEIRERISELEAVIFERHKSKRYDENYHLYSALMTAYKVFLENDKFTNNVTKELFFE